MYPSNPLYLRLKSLYHLALFSTKTLVFLDIISTFASKPTWKYNYGNTPHAFYLPQFPRNFLPPLNFF